MQLLYLIVLALLALASPVAADSAESFFDPRRHMRVEEVQPGMKGYGLTVLKGTQIERFNVEVVSILRNFNPKHDVVLVRCSGANLEHTGSIAGMSGSPIFLTDEQGRERMIGAFAYGWPMMKDPLGGVQPIEYMLKMRQSANIVAPAATQPITKSEPEAMSIGPQRWHIGQAIALPGMKHAPPPYPFAAWNSFKPNPRLGADDPQVMKLRPLATPLMTSGLASPLLEQLEAIFQEHGLAPLQSGGSGGATTAPAPKLEPGAVLAVPLLTGDMDMTAIGTCTEVIDAHVFGFGHAFMSEGPVTLPMGVGKIDGVVANLMTSFKLGSLVESRGALYTDELAGIAGKLDSEAPIVPIRLSVSYADGSMDEVFNFKCAVHPRFTPLLSTAALTAAITGQRDLPEYHTLDYDLSVAFNNGQMLRMKNIAVNSNAGQLFYELGAPMIAASENPFERVLVREITGSVVVRREVNEATILSVNVPRLKFRPGETIKLFVTYRPFRAGEAMLPIQFELPRDLPDGPYQLVVSDWEQYLIEEQQARPFRFTAESVEEVFTVMRELSEVRHDAVYVRLVRQADGIAVGRTAMPNLPSSRREVLMGAGRSNTTPFVSSTVKAVPAGHVMSGSAQFVIEVDKYARVEVGGPPGQKPERVVPAPETDKEPKPKAPTKQESPTGTNAE